MPKFAPEIVAAPSHAEAFFLFSRGTIDQLAGILTKTGLPLDYQAERAPRKTERHIVFELRNRARSFGFRSQPNKNAVPMFSVLSLPAG